MLTAALELGGTHASTGLVAVGRGAPALHDQQRAQLDSRATLDRVLASLDDTCAAVIAPGRPWAIALPGPFDYTHGIGGRHTDGKFHAFADVDLRALLTERWQASRISFCNDAHAFAAGAWDAYGRPVRLFAMTLGTGIGSAFLHAGRLADDPELPAELYREPQPDGRSLEDHFGPRALVDRHNLSGHTTVGSFRDLAALARKNVSVRRMVTAHMTGLVDALAPWWRGFRPEIIVIGGSVCHAWDIFGTTIRERVTHHLGNEVRVQAVTDTESVSLVGAVIAGTL